MHEVAVTIEEIGPTVSADANDGTPCVDDDDEAAAAVAADCCKECLVAPCDRQTDRHAHRNTPRPYRDGVIMQFSYHFWPTIGRAFRSLCRLSVCLSVCRL